MAITKFADHIRIKLISQLNKGVSSVLQKLLKHFNGAVASKSLVLTSSGVFPVIFTLNLKGSESVTVAFGSSL